MTADLLKIDLIDLHKKEIY